MRVSEILSIGWGGVSFVMVYIYIYMLPIST